MKRASPAVQQYVIDRPLQCRLAAKADEEDSDAEDTELELTADEKAERHKAQEKHKEECEKVRRACLVPWGSGGKDGGVVVGG
jgi:hypothetical protein